MTFRVLRARCLRKEHGYTLMELMTVLAIIGILTSIVFSDGNSGFFKFQSHNEAARGAFSALSVGRSHAVRKNRTVVVHVASDHVRAFEDANSNLVYDAGVDTSVFRYPTDESKVIKSTLLYFATALAAAQGGQASVIFDYQGMSVNTSGEPLSAMICVQQTELNKYWAVDVTVAGSVRIVDAQGRCN